jgi:hypothetical protein
MLDDKRLAENVTRNAQPAIVELLRGFTAYLQVGMGRFLIFLWFLQKRSKNGVRGNAP